ncbi:MAG: 2-C-methyl-D-erythritol 2,4-cyclodiphosphate synthase [Flavobacteriales bacterium]|nr:2-C-methyl-D-erythritol 2,4-cyclodiphosphate synthase [Flavobacteriales bacterium]
MKIRVGFGFDIHRLASGGEFWLGGILIPYEKGAVGHSDADVLIHAICDALLGAANLRDIGYHFPDTDPEYKNVDSKLLLKDVLGLVKKKGFEIGNIDCTISLEKPKINPHIPNMVETLAEILELDSEDISIKATTNEKLGYLGRNEGIHAYCVALIQK